MTRALPALAAALAVLASGCSSSTPRTVKRPELVIRESPDPGAAVQDASEHATGHFKIRLLTARCGIDSIVGTHAEFTPKHPLCVVRVRVRSDDATYHAFTPGRQQLVLADGTAVPVDPEIMRIRRQEKQVELGAYNTLELDLWFEPEVSARATAIRLFGDSDADPGESTVRHRAADSVLVPLTGLR